MKTQHSQINLKKIFLNETGRMRISPGREIEARVKVMNQGEAAVNSRSKLIRMKGGRSKVKNTKIGFKGLGMWVKK